MSILNKLKYAFGLDSTHDLEDDDDFRDLPDATVTRPRPQQRHEDAPVSRSNTTQNREEKTTASQTANTPVAVNDDDAIDKIFEHVVSTFNIALPDFLRKSVDPEAQRKYLYSTLQSDLQHYLKNLAANAESKYRDQWHSERDKLNSKLREAERLAAEYGEKNKELRQNLLSADRQKRALSTRSADLEKQILTLEADREQRQLENKSMANKVKAVQVYEQEIKEMQAQIDQLNNELDNARKQLTSSKTSAPAASGQEAPGDANLIVELRKKLAEADRKIAEADKKTQEADRKIADAESKSASAVKQVDDAEKKVAELSQQLKNQADDYGKRLRKQADEIAALQLENEKARVNLQSEHKSENPQSTMPNRTTEMPAVDAWLDADSEPKTEPKTERKPRRQRNADPLLDDILGDTEWIMPPSTTSKRKNKDNDRNRHDNDDDRQMSLF